MLKNTITECDLKNKLFLFAVDSVLHKHFLNYIVKSICRTMSQSVSFFIGVETFTLVWSASILFMYIISSSSNSYYGSSLT